jgi:hypothetical protein
MIQKTLSLLLCVSGLSISAAFGFSTDPSSLTRNFSSASAATNTPIVVTVTFTNGAGSVSRGFCYSEQMPTGLSVTTLGLWLNGQSVENYTFESGLDSDVYPGCTPCRWVLELPPNFTENNPLPPDSTVQIQYSITSPTIGGFNLQQFDWAGYDLVNTNASFGYSESSDAQSVSFDAGLTSHPILTTATSGMNFSSGPGTNPPSQLLGITNSGGGTMSWTVVADASAPAWLTVSPNNGMGDGTVIVSISSAGLAAAGSYTKNLTVTAIGAANGLQTVGVTNSFSGAVQTVSPEITSLSFPDNLAVVTWTSTVGGSYRVQYLNDLTNTNWTNLSPDITADGPTAMATDTNGLFPQRFYRILLLAP